MKILPLWTIPDTPAAKCSLHADMFDALKHIKVLEPIMKYSQ